MWIQLLDRLQKHLTLAVLDVDSCFSSNDGGKLSTFPKVYILWEEKSSFWITVSFSRGITKISIVSRVCNTVRFLIVWSSFPLKSTPSLLDFCGYQRCLVANIYTWLKPFHLPLNRLVKLFLFLCLILLAMSSRVESGVF